MGLQNVTFASALPTNVKFGIGIVERELVADIQSNGKKKVFLATDKGLVQAGIAGKVSDLLTTQGIEVVMFSDVEPNPYAETVMRGARIYQEEQCEMIVALGGGSSMDFAKAVGVMLTHPGHVLDYRRGGQPITEEIPLLYAIPTTVGTGSEVTAVAVITDPEKGRKYVLASPNLRPKVAYVDPSLTYSLPRQHVAATGCDALVHAIEAYTSVRATPISDGLAMQAIKMLKEYLPRTYAHPDDTEARAQVHLASTIAGMAFGLAGVGLVHSCSHPMSAVYHVPHGLANAVILPYVLEYNLIANYKKFADIARVFDSSLVLESDVEAAKSLVSLIRDFTKSLDIPDDFSYLGIDVTDEVIQRLSNDAMDDVGTIPVNPRKVYREDVVKIYQKLLPQK